VAFSAGSVMGFTVVGLGLFDISVWFMLLRFVFKLEAADITSAMLTFGMGASSMALFARVGGGIFTKAADVGADLVVSRWQAAMMHSTTIMQAKKIPTTVYCRRR